MADTHSAVFFSACPPSLSLSLVVALGPRCLPKRGRLLARGVRRVFVPQCRARVRNTTRLVVPFVCPRRGVLPSMPRFLLVLRSGGPRYTVPRCEWMYTGSVHLSSSARSLLDCRCSHPLQVPVARASPSDAASALVAPEAADTAAAAAAAAAADAIAPVEVTRLLREMGEPVRLFAEDFAARRARLRALQVSRPEVVRGRQRNDYMDAMQSIDRDDAEMVCPPLPLFVGYVGRTVCVCP